MDRIDIQVEVPALPAREFTAIEGSRVSSADLRKRVMAARSCQFTRQGKLNCRMQPQDIEQHCALSVARQQLLLQAIDRLNLSHRAFHRTLKLARTIADLDNSKELDNRHLMEALSLRRMH